MLRTQLKCLSLQGYQGMVDGGDHIKEMGWKDVSGVIQLVSLIGAFTQFEHFFATATFAATKFAYIIRSCD